MMSSVGTGPQTIFAYLPENDALEVTKNIKQVDYNKLLPLQGLTFIYVHDALLVDDSSPNTKVFCFFSFLRQSKLRKDKEVFITTLKEQRKIGVIEVKQGIIKSVMLCPTIVNLFKQYEVNDVILQESGGNYRFTASQIQFDPIKMNYEKLLFLRLG